MATIALFQVPLLFFLTLLFQRIQTKNFVFFVMFCNCNNVQSMVRSGDFRTLFSYFNHIFLKTLKALTLQGHVLNYM